MLHSPAVTAYRIKFRNINSGAASKVPGPGPLQNWNQLLMWSRVLHFCHQQSCRVAVYDAGQHRCSERLAREVSCTGQGELGWEGFKPRPGMRQKQKPASYTPQDAAFARDSQFSPCGTFIISNIYESNKNKIYAAYASRTRKVSRAQAFMPLPRSVPTGWN